MTLLFYSAIHALPSGPGAAAVAALELERLWGPPHEQAEGSWRLAGRSVAAVSDAVALEAAFASDGVDSATTALLTVALADAPPARHVVSVRNLGTGALTEARARASGCAPYDAPWRGDDPTVAVLLVPPPSARTEAPALVLADGGAAPYVLLAPSDVVEVRRVSRGGEVVAVQLVVTRPAGSLELRHESEKTWICAGET